MEDQSNKVPSRIEM